MIKEYRIMKPKKRCETCRFFDDGIASHTWKFSCKIRKEESGEQIHVHSCGRCQFYKERR